MASHRPDQEQQLEPEQPELGLEPVRERESELGSDSDQVLVWQVVHRHLALRLGYRLALVRDSRYRGYRDY